MTTATLNNQKVTVSAAVLYDLLSGAAIAADSSKDAIGQLGAVYLVAEGNKLTAAATDRYRLVEGVAELDGGALSASCLTLHDVKRILALIKPYLRVGGIIDVEKNGTSLTFTINGGDSVLAHSLDYSLPDYASMISDTFSPIPTVSLNLTLLASLAKIPHDSKQPVAIGFTAEGKAIQIRMTHDSITWRALLMPMRNK